MRQEANLAQTKTKSKSKRASRDRAELSQTKSQYIVPEVPISETEFLKQEASLAQT